MSDETAVQTTKSREDKKCSQEGCKRPYKAKALCNVHYRKWRHGELPGGRYKTCTKEGCNKARAKGAQGSFCAEHGGAGADAPAA